MAYGQRDRGGVWRARYKLPDDTWTSRTGFTSKTAAKDWGDEQEALIRRNMWINPRDAETRFGEFVEKWFEAVSPRLEPGTAAKYRTVINTHLKPQWETWPMIGIFNSYVEIEKWVSELHEDYADSTVATIFATFPRSSTPPCGPISSPPVPAPVSGSRPASSPSNGWSPRLCRCCVRRCGSTNVGWASVDSCCA